MASLVPQLLIGTIVPYTICTIVVCVRIYSRAVLLRRWGADDACVLVSWALATALGGILWFSASIGVGRHVDQFDFANANILLHTTLASKMIYVAALAASKISICASYIRIFQDKVSVWIARTMIIIIVIYSVAIILASGFECKDLSKTFDITAACTLQLQNPVLYSTGVLSIATDVFLLLFVIYKLIPLKLPYRQKIALFATMAVSLLAIVAAVLRVVYSLRSANLQQGNDFTWHSVDIFLWSTIEVFTGLFCAAVPGIKPFLQKVTPAWWSWNSMSSSENRTGPGRPAALRSIGDKRQEQNGYGELECPSAEESIYLYNHNKSDVKGS